MNRPSLDQYLDTVIVAVADDQPALGIELDRVRRPELARPHSGLADGPEKSTGPVEHRDAPDKVRILHVGMTLGHIDVAVGGIGHHVCRFGQGLRRISLHAWCAQRHQHLALRTELDDNASLLPFSRRLLQLVCGGGARVGHVNVSVTVDMDAMRPHEHSAAKAPDFLPGCVEKVNRVCSAAETPGHGARRATVDCPDGLAVFVDGYAVGATPRPFLRRELRPITNDLVGIGAAVDRLEVAIHRGTRRLGRLASEHGHRHDNSRSKPTSR